MGCSRLERACVHALRAYPRKVYAVDVEGSVLTVQLSPSVNLQNLTIEEVVSTMQRSHLQLVNNLADEFRFAGAPQSALVHFDRMKRCTAHPLTFHTILLE